jgi:predicted RNase H-like nuclease
MSQQEVKQAVAPMWINLDTANNRLRQISQLCWELVNELREADNLLVGEYPDEFSKVFDVANEIETWLIEGKQNENS